MILQLLLSRIICNRSHGHPIIAIPDGTALKQNATPRPIPADIETS